jgi:hypothetical protein
MTTLPSCQPLATGQQLLAARTLYPLALAAWLAALLLGRARPYGQPLRLARVLPATGRGREVQLGLQGQLGPAVACVSRA